MYSLPNAFSRGKPWAEYEKVEGHSLGRVQEGQGQACRVQKVRGQPWPSTRRSRRPAEYEKVTGSPGESTRRPKSEPK